MFYAKFLETVERWPEQIAVEFQRQQGSDGPALERYTYAQLRHMAESVGQWLNVSAAPTDARCAILASNSPRWLAAYLGVVASGRTAVPLDIAFNAAQVRKLLLDSGASVAFVDARNVATAREATEGLSVQLVMVDTSAAGLPQLSEIFAAGPAGFSPATVALDDIACLLYTSGTTSDPKGVMLSHFNLLGELDAVKRFIDVSERDAILGVLPLFHALAQMANLFIPLAFGARVVFLESLNTTELMRALGEREITIFCCVPQFFYLIHERVMKQVAEKGGFAQKAFKLMMATSRFGRMAGLNLGKVFFRPVHKLLGPRMNYLVTGGSRFDAAIGRDFQALGFELLQAYGLTETTGGACCTPPRDNVMGSIGKPLPGVEARIADAQKPTDSDGPAIGEICIRGQIVMKGYYKRPDATAAVIKDGWLYTGDLGYMDADGNIFITGRKKEVIVLSSGKNIYPEEIEAHYLQSPAIKEIAVMGLVSKPGEPFSERLHAVVVPNFDFLKQKKIVNVREVMRYDIEGLSAQLPSTKRILSYEIWQEDLPRTTTRKLRRFEIEKRVREQQAKASGPEREISATRPLTEDEQRWMSEHEVGKAIGVLRGASKLKKEGIRPDDNLELDLGLDSMERVEVLVALEHELGSDVEDSAASEVYTVRELVDLVRANTGKGGGRMHQGWDVLLTTEVSDPEVLRITKPRPVIEKFWYLFGRFVTLFTRDVFKLKITGMEKLPKRGPFILSPNHQSYLDAPILTANLPYPIFVNTFYVGTSEIFGSGLMRYLARFLRLIPVDPDANLVPAMRAGAYGLQHGRVLVLYPEGERSIDGPPKLFKKGAAILSRHMGVPIVPVALDGFFDAWPRGKGFQKFATLRIAIGDPIYPDMAEPPEKAYDRLTNELKSRVMEMWNGLHAELSALKEKKKSAAA